MLRYDDTSVVCFVTCSVQWLVLSFLTVFVVLLSQSLRSLLSRPVRRDLAMICTASVLYDALLSCPVIQYVHVLFFNFIKTVLQNLQLLYIEQNKLCATLFCNTETRHPFYSNEFISENCYSLLKDFQALFYPIPLLLKKVHFSLKKYVLGICHQKKTYIEMEPLLQLSNLKSSSFLLYFFIFKHVQLCFFVSCPHPL